MTPDEFEQLPWDTAFESSNIARIAFVKDDPEDFGADGHGTLYVEFQGGRSYAYDAVSYERHAELLDARSVGGYLNEHIKPNHTCQRVLLSLT